jgi:hypothetical protein
MFKVTLNKFHKNRNSDISLINWVSYRLEILFWCPDNQNEFYKHKKWTTSLWRNPKLHDKLRLQIPVRALINARKCTGGLPQPVKLKNRHMIMLLRCRPKQNVIKC